MHLILAQKPFPECKLHCKNNFSFHIRPLRPTYSPKDVGVNIFYEELFRWWNVRLKPGQIVEVIEDSDDDESDFTEFMIVVKSDPYESLSSPPAKAGNAVHKEQVTLFFMFISVSKELPLVCYANIICGIF